MSARLFSLRCRCGTLCSVVAYALTMLCVFWVVLRGAESMGYNWQWYRVPRFILLPDGSPGPLLQGAGITLLVSALGFVGAAVLALGTALLRLSGSVVGQAAARCYLELIRNTPLLVQIFFVYFVLAPAVGLGRLPSAVLALALFEGAYASEIIRAGILAIPRGQWEGALSLGMSRASVYMQVILPQALRNILPPLTSQAVSLIKDSALVSTIAIYDLTMHGQAIIAETFLSFEIWSVVAAIYLVFTVTLSSLARLLEKRSSSPHLEGSCTE
ncbi:amino acid ABC transporter permease [Desulfomicrobium baculatum]|uniref:Polar amino acid ABC transporter, inner membrane subunit n=1 Tax=Desulfomicrobium baculatum (strain DSM 4028 / VKM B-1378 / X) TaxID=525897 RepID=C7LSC5_DESBD|nr:amino acid ABC transporter permease [Desulfomicrobium baculatum]ACU90673.1 polar amino acid ABC transporter, inner membrane subunit [Desulfomicrobium baculatum DSM 4028]